jgi:hypothetical protein
MHPLNLALRFFLEIAALGGFAILAWQLTEGWWRLITAAVALACIMTLWGVFAVPGDPSRSGNAPIPVSGMIRLGLELAVLLGGAYALYWSGHIYAAYALAGLVILHYALSIERITWLLQH